MKHLRILMVIAFAVSALSACSYSSSLGEAPIFSGVDEVDAVEEGGVVDEMQDVEEDPAGVGSVAVINAPEHSFVPADPNWHEMGLVAVNDRMEVILEEGTANSGLPEVSWTPPQFVAEEPEFVEAPADEIQVRPTLHLGGAQIEKSPEFTEAAKPSLGLAKEGADLSCFPDCS